MYNLPTNHIKWLSKRVTAEETSMSISNPLSRLIPLLLCLFVLAACNQDQVLDTQQIQQAEILNLTVPEANALASGQPTEEQLRVLAASGVKHIVNLRGADEQDWDEAAVVESLGMQYHSIPVVGAEGLSNENAQSLSRLLAEISGEPVLVHCASGNRVGALVAINANQQQGMDIESAITEGKRWGLNQIEPRVREVLN